MKTLSDFAVAALLIFILWGAIYHDEPLKALEYMVLGLALRFIWEFRRKNIFNWSEE